MEKIASKDNRVEIFDIAKGLAIILVVIAHLKIPEFWVKFCYLFHMPLFFFMAGYFFKDINYSTLEKVFLYIKKRFFRLICVYLGFSVFFIIIHNFLINIHVYKLSTGNISYSHSIVPYYNSLKDMFMALLTHVEPLIQPAWFLLALFMVATLFAILSYLISKISKNIEWLRFLTILVFMQIGFWLYLHKINIAYIGTVCSAIPVYYFGYLASKMNTTNLFNRISFGVSLILLLIINIITPKSVNLATNFYYNPVFLILVTVLGSLLILSLSNIIYNINDNASNLLSFIGQNTIPILLLHKIAFKMLNYIYIFIYNMSIEDLYLQSLSSNFLGIILYTLAGIAIPLCISLLYKKTKNIIINNIIKFKTKEEL